MTQPQLTKAETAAFKYLETYANMDGFDVQKAFLAGVDWSLENGDMLCYVGRKNFELGYKAGVKAENDRLQPAEQGPPEEIGPMGE